MVIEGEWMTEWVEGDLQVRGLRFSENLVIKTANQDISAARQMLYLDEEQFQVTSAREFIRYSNKLITQYYCHCVSRDWSFKITFKALL